MPIEFTPNTKDPGMEEIKKILSHGLVPAAIAFALLAAFCFMTIRIGYVSGEQVGIMLDRFTGKIEIVEQSGAKIYNGIRHSFSVLDKTMQTLEMTENVNRGDRVGRDDLKIKTKDGSDVSVDVKVQYRIISTDADKVVATSGLGDAYKVKWARDYARSTIRNFLGELTTEEFYDSSKRDAKLVMAQKKLNDQLMSYGLRIDSIVIPQRPHFYKEYEAMIKKKKLADQAVLEEQSKALAAKQKQETELVKERNLKNVAVEQYKGEMQQLVIAAEAESNRLIKQADAYYQKVTINAEAHLYAQEKLSEGILAQKTSEAEGIKEMNKALEAAGGRNMVKLEYARRLADVHINGQPFTMAQHTERFAVGEERVAAKKKTRK